MSFKYSLEDGGNKMIVDDPIYGQIEINSPFVEIILTKEMQRLNDITQNGFSIYDFPGLKNNERLSHSVGAFYVMSQIIEHLEKELKRYDIFISKDDKDMALCSMLLHDIGHGPFSHSFEKITKYSHEKRTTDILLGNTDVGNLLTSIYGTAKLKRIASYIAEIDEYEDEERDETKNSFTKLLKSLISHQIDADRLDYLVRDAYHAGITSAINYKNVINTLGISVNSNQDYELLVDRKGLSSIETILIERFQRYRDVYYSRSDGLLEQVFLKILERYRENPNSVNEDLPEVFKKLASDPNNLSLEDFLLMTDKEFNRSFDIIHHNSSDPILRYLSNMPKVLEDYQDLENKINADSIKERLKDVFIDKDFTNTFSIISIKMKNKLYKKEESLRINFGNVYKDLSEVTPQLIRPEEYLEVNELMFNPEVLRLELGMTEKQFDPYKEEIKTIINELNKKPEEFELKYIIDKDKKITQVDILNILLENGFKVVTTKNKENDDEYYDTKDLFLLSKGGSLRIRKLTQDGKERYKATYKMPTSIGEVYSSRKEIEIELENKSIQELIEKMGKRNLNVDLEKILPNPLLNSVTQRKDIVLDKNGVQVCLSFDNTKYTNHVTKGKTAEDFMIEIEALGSIEDRVMLNEINEVLKNEFPDLQTNKQSKYERGTRKTRQKERQKTFNENEEIDENVL